jgi:hypothetical protein
LSAGKVCVRFIHGSLIILLRKGNNAQGCEPPALQLSSRFAVIVIPKEVSQLASVAKLPARLLMLTGRIYEHNKSIMWLNSPGACQSHPRANMNAIRGVYSLTIPQTLWPMEWHPYRRRRRSHMPEGSIELIYRTELAYLRRNFSEETI